jgi:hypothetical protein
MVRGKRGIYIYPDTVYINTTLSSHHSHFILYIEPLKMDLTEGSETSEKLNLTPENTQKNIYKNLLSLRDHIAHGILVCHICVHCTLPYVFRTDGFVKLAEGTV